MFVRRMNIDCWQDRANHGGKVVDPGWGDVTGALISLDGKQKTSVILSNAEDSDAYIIIAGQWDGRFLVNATINSFDFFTLVDAAGSTNKRTLFIGGQDGEYEERKLVPLDWVLQAAKVFFDTGKIDPSSPWRSDY